jgi:hypothetical protein
MEKHLEERYINSEKVVLVRDLLDFLEEDLLNYEVLPDDYLSFLMLVFSTIDFFESKDTWKILHFLTSENLSKNQFRELSYVIAKNFQQYSASMLQDMSCDFIARCNEPELALTLLSEMAKEALNKSQKRAVLVGLNILATHADSNSGLRKRIKELAEFYS